MMLRLRSVKAAAKRSSSAIPVRDRRGRFPGASFADAATSSDRRVIGPASLRLENRQPSRPTSTVSSMVMTSRSCTLRENANSRVVETVPTSIQWLPSENGALRLYSESGTTEA